MREDGRVPVDTIAASVDVEGIRSVLDSTDVQYAVLFGSYATGSETVSSDLDICVRFTAECSKHERFQQRNQIDSTLQSYAEPFVDVSDLETLPDTVALNALQDGVLLYGDQTKKAADERRLERQVAASKSHRERQQREFIDRLAEGNV